MNQFCSYKAIKSNFNVCNDCITLRIYMSHQRTTVPRFLPLTLLLFKSKRKNSQ